MSATTQSDVYIRLFGRYLREHGLPVTHQREVVADVVFSSSAHLSVDDIESEVRAAALQFVRKISGYRHPSQVNTAIFESAVDEITAVSRTLLASLQQRLSAARP